MKHALDFIIKNIVAKPEAVSIEEEISEDGYANLKLTVDQQDMGTVIGRAGHTIRAIRDLIRVKAIRDGKRVGIELIEQQCE